MWQFYYWCSSWTLTNDLISFKIGPVPNFPILSHGLSLNTNANALTRALQSVNKRKKNIQCCQLKFFQRSQHKQIPFLSFLAFPLFCPLPLYIYKGNSTEILSSLTASFLFCSTWSHQGTGMHPIHIHSTNQTSSICPTLPLLYGAS
jgi:hypothetical protein